MTPDDSERPIAFASRTLSQAEHKYAQLDKEALSIIFGVKRFHQYLYGRHFNILSDHKPLQYLLGENRGIPAMASARIQRWALTLSAYSTRLTTSLELPMLMPMVSVDCNCRSNQQKSPCQERRFCYSRPLTALPYEQNRSENG